jgi:hypothetical protein
MLGPYGFIQNPQGDPMDSLRIYRGPLYGFSENPHGEKQKHLLLRIS